VAALRAVEGAVGPPWEAFFKGAPSERWASLSGLLAPLLPAPNNGEAAGACGGGVTDDGMLSMLAERPDAALRLTAVWACVRILSGMCLTVSSVHGSTRPPWCPSSSRMVCRR
jgi:hypothetical protein